MTTGEKIKTFRKLKEMTQKTLSTKSGVSEISIRKYEAGERHAKPEQLLKIADALNINIALLIDIELPPVNLETVGDFMSLFFTLQKAVGARIQYDVDSNNNVMPETLSVVFDNRMANHHLLHLAYQENLTKQLVQAAIDEGNAPDSKKVSDVRESQDFTADLVKRQLMALTALLSDKDTPLD